MTAPVAPRAETVEAKAEAVANLPAVIPPNPIEDLTTKIKSDYARLQYGAVANAERAATIGEYLLALKVEMRARKAGGVFTKYVVHELGIPERLAQRWMSKAREKAKYAKALGLDPTDCRFLAKADGAIE